MNLRTMKAIILNLLLIMALNFNFISCHFPDCRLKVTNKSNRTLYLQYSPDTLNESWIHKFDKNFYINNYDTLWVSEAFVKAGSIKETCTFSKWEKLINEISPEKKIYIYVFDSAYFWQYHKGVKRPLNNIVLRYAFSLEDIKKSNWNITIK